MLIFPKQRLVILAVPKTGTTAIDRALNRRAPITIKGSAYGKHMSMLEYRKFLEPFALSVSDGQPYEHFALFREPMSWLSSWYRYRQSEQMKNPALSTRGIGFDAFIEACLQPKPPKFAVNRPQSSYVCHEDGTLGVERLFRYEDMDRAVAFLSERLEVEIELGEKNISAKIPVSLAPELDAACRARFRREFDIHDSIG